MQHFGTGVYSTLVLLSPGLGTPESDHAATRPCATLRVASIRPWYCFSREQGRRGQIKLRLLLLDQCERAYPDALPHWGYVSSFKAPFHDDDVFPEDHVLHDMMVPGKPATKGRTNWSWRAAFPFMIVPGISSDA